jgi:Cu/Ag efflux pump CusA
MLDRLIDLSVRFRWIVALLAVALLAYGGSQLLACPSTPFPTSPTARCRSTPSPPPSVPKRSSGR